MVYLTFRLEIKDSMFPFYIQGCNFYFLNLTPHWDLCNREGKEEKTINKILSADDMESGKTRSFYKRATRDKL